MSLPMYSYDGKDQQHQPIMFVDGQIAEETRDVFYYGRYTMKIYILCSGYHQYAECNIASLPKSWPSYTSYPI